MTVSMILFSCFLLLMVAGFCWVTYCNEKCLKQIRNLIDIFYDRGNYEPIDVAMMNDHRKWIRENFKDTYSNHFWDLVFFINPMKRYYSFNEFVGKEVIK